MATLDFERPLRELEQRIEALKAAIRLPGADEALADEIERLEASARRLEENLFGDLGVWARVRLSRHSERPTTLDAIGALFEDFIELRGDRAFRDDPAIVGGLGRYRGAPVVVLGHQKGRGVKDNVRRNFGMPHPEGYRKALRLMDLAARFQRPLITFVDTPGAFPGLGAEERGQSEAIGQCLMKLSSLTVPVVSTVLGEGGSGGALALAVANRVLMLEHSTYAVITPEGCASILWKDGSRAPEAARAMRMTAAEVFSAGVADEVIPEPVGGAHRDPAEALRRVDEAVGRHLDALRTLGPEALREDRYQRFRALGEYSEG
ncbi:MAG: acetyl-CoA carboxylase carboxyltransferase subunit alpha [Deltaproteobacteria bacterium]|nr:acetyl-CoA carboxylase carboxyltransferase subunit alpha [Deltaproteobacteria bacterium]